MIPGPGNPIVQVAEAVTSCLVPFDKEAVAVNCCCCPMAKRDFAEVFPDQDTVRAVTVGDGDVALEPLHATAVSRKTSRQVRFSIVTVL
jgi:hypothetical protein